MYPVCIHSETNYTDPELICGRRALLRVTHGWLCPPHYTAQQKAIPEKPRLPQQKWNGYAKVQILSDSLIVKDIITTDAAMIAEAKQEGRLKRIQCGVNGFEPLYLTVEQAHG